MRKAMMTATTLFCLFAPAGPWPIPAGAAIAATDEDPLYVRLPGISAPIFGPGRVEGKLNLMLVLQVADEGAVQAISRRMPELRATALAATLEFARLYASGYTPVNVGQLHAQLAAAMRRADPRIIRILIVRVAAQPS